jgi:hypothetical protein
MPRETVSKSERRGAQEVWNFTPKNEETAKNMKMKTSRASFTMVFQRPSRVELVLPFKNRRSDEKGVKIQSKNQITE